MDKKYIYIYKYIDMKYGYMNYKVKFIKSNLNINYSN